MVHQDAGCRQSSSKTNSSKLSNLSVLKTKHFDDPICTICPLFSKVNLVRASSSLKLRANEHLSTEHSTRQDVSYL